MGLFGRGKEEEKRQVSALMLQEEQRRLEREEKSTYIQQIAEKQEAFSKCCGALGNSETELLGITKKYKFAYTDEAFVFYPIITRSSYDLRSMPKEELQRYVSLNRPISLDRNHYFCQLVNNQLPLEKSESVVGEGIINVSPIRLMFKNTTDSTEILFDIENNPKNIMPMADFFKGLGVKNYFNVLDIPEEMMNISVLEGNGFLTSNKEYLTYRKNGVLTLIRQDRNYNGLYKLWVTEIDLDEIIYYKSEGSVRYEQMVSGSGGGENSYTGALVGGLLFGAAGAIIGSRANEKKTEISTTTVTHDDRILMLNVKRNSVLYSISLKLNAEPVLEWLIPEKQYEYVIQKRREMYEKNPLI